MLWEDSSGASALPLAFRVQWWWGRRAVRCPAAPGEGAATRWRGRPVSQGPKAWLQDVGWHRSPEDR